MSKPPRHRRPHPRIRITETNDENRPEKEVGYGKPPLAHRFKPGKSGNSRGRPKGAKSEATILYELLNRKISIREDGKTRKITVLEAILLRFTEDSLKGNTKSAAFLLNRHGALVSGEPQQTDFSDDDQEILEAFAQRFAAQRATRGGES